MQFSQPSCHCGRVFTTWSALMNHQHTCVKSKKHLSSTLDKAKLLLGSKWHRIEQEPSISKLASDTPAIQPMPNQVIVYSSTAIIKSILLILLFAFRYLLIQQMKINPWQQDDSVDRIVGFLNDSKILYHFIQFGTRVWLWHIGPIWHDGSHHHQGLWPVTIIGFSALAPIGRQHLWHVLQFHCTILPYTSHTYLYIQKIKSL